MLSVRQGSVNTNFIIIALTRLGIKPKSTAPEADGLTTRLSKLLQAYSFFFLQVTQNPNRNCSEKICTCLLVFVYVRYMVFRIQSSTSNSCIPQSISYKISSSDMPSTRNTSYGMGSIHGWSRSHLTYPYRDYRVAVHSKSASSLRSLAQSVEFSVQ